MATSKSNANSNMSKGASTPSEEKLAIPTAIIGVISMILAAWLCHLSNVRFKRLKPQTEILFGLDLDLIYRRLLLLQNIKYMAAMDVLFSLWILLNWGSIAVTQSFGFSQHHKLCFAAGMLLEFSLTGTIYFYILITVTMMGIMRVCFDWKCCRNNGWLCDRFYPQLFDNDNQWLRAHRYQCGLVFTIIIIGTISVYPEYVAMNNSSDPNYYDPQCRLAGWYPFLHYSPMIIALILGFISVTIAWRKRDCRCTADTELDWQIRLTSNVNDVIIGREFALSISFFALAFWVGYIYNIVIRVYNFAGNPLSLWMLCVHHYCAAITPSLNFLVWHRWDPSHSQRAAAADDGENEVSEVSDHSLTVSEAAAVETELTDKTQY